MTGGGGAHGPVRAFARGLDVIEALADLGWVRISALSAHVGLDRATTYRLVGTLERYGYVVRRSEDGAVALAARFQRLADGVRDDDIVAQAVAPPLFGLTRKVLWPSDFGSLQEGAMMIRTSTHRISPWTIHRHLVGKTRPLLRSAIGRAFLSALPESDLFPTLEVARRLNGPDPECLDRDDAVAAMIEEVRRNGYASSAGLIEQRISAIALPLRAGRRVVGAVNIAYFTSAMTTAEAARRYLEPLREAVAAAELALGQIGSRA